MTVAPAAPRWPAPVGRVVLITLALAFVAGACGVRRVDVGDRYQWRQYPVLRNRPLTTFTFTILLPAPMGGGRPEVIVWNGDDWTLQPLSDEPGFVTAVIKWGDQAVAVGAVGADTLPTDPAATTVLRSAMWIGDEDGNWARAELPAPADGPGWFLGIESFGGRVAVGRTAGADGDVFAVRADDSSLRSWTSSIVAGGPGLQVAGAVGTRGDRTIVTGVGTTWTSRDGEPWLASPQRGLDADRTATVVVLAEGDTVFLAGGAAAPGDTGFVRVDPAGRDPGEPRPVLAGRRALTGMAFASDLLVVTDTIGTADAPAKKGRRLGLVTIDPNGVETTDELPLRVADAVHLSSWPSELGGSRGALAWRRPDGSLGLATLRLRP